MINVIITPTRQNALRDPIIIPNDIHGRNYLIFKIFIILKRHIIALTVSHVHRASRTVTRDNRNISDWVYPGKRYFDSVSDLWTVTFVSGFVDVVRNCCQSYLKMVSVCRFHFTYHFTKFFPSLVLHFLLLLLHNLTLSYA